MIDLNSLAPNPMGTPKVNPLSVLPPEIAGALGAASRPDYVSAPAEPATLDNNNLDSKVRELQMSPEEKTLREQTIGAATGTGEGFGGAGAPKSDETSPLPFSMHTNPKPEESTPPPEIAGMIGAVPEGDNFFSTAKDQDLSKLANVPPSEAGAPQRPKTPLAGRLLQLAGVIGAGLDAAGHPMQEPKGAEMLQAGLEKQQERQLQRERIAQVEAPLAQAHADYFKQFNPTKIAVQGMKGENALDVQDLKNAGNLDVERMKMLYQAGMIGRTTNGIDPETGEPTTLAYNKMGGLIGALRGSLANASFYGKQTFSDLFMPNAEGNIEKLRKGTSTGPVLPRPGTMVPPQGGGAPQFGPQGGSQGPVRIAPQGPQGPAVNPGGTVPSPRPQGGGVRATPVFDSNGNSMHKPLPVEATKTLAQIKTTQGMIQEVLPDLQSVVNDMRRGGNLADSTKTRIAWGIYSKLGLDPSNVDPNSIIAEARRQFGYELDPRLARIFPTLAMVQVLGVQPYLRGIRNMDYVHQIQQHLPNPEMDSPDFMLSKLTQLSHNLPIAEKAIWESNGITSHGPQSGGNKSGGGNNTPPPTNTQPTHIVKDAQGNRIGTVVNNKYVPDQKK